jgi:hypothetical protein
VPIYRARQGCNEAPCAGFFLCFYTVEYKKDGPGCILQKINPLDDVSPDVFALYFLVLERHYGRKEQKVPGHAPA